MIRYFCDKCRIETTTSECSTCGERTRLVETSVYWCPECNIPLYEDICHRCGHKAKRIGSDIRPVFPEERLLIELMMGCPMKYAGASVWQVSGNMYIADGKKIPFSKRLIHTSDPAELRAGLEKYGEENKKAYETFNKYIERFVTANQARYGYILTEAAAFIRKAAADFDANDMYVSFSGGKDSTVTSDLVMRALSNPQILHVYGDTTLEFPETKEYVGRFKKAHPKTPVLTSINKDKNFEELCEQLGPPSRVMRWCCTIFKTGAIQRKITTLFKGHTRVLTYLGFRRSESTSRSKYDRESDSPKIAIQRTASAIIDWLDFDIWLYLLTTGIDFNTAYRYGYTRVGCWCCPNNSEWSGFLSRIYMPEQYEHFRDILISFAKKIGKEDAENYVDSGNWKARQGGNGMDYANTSVITFEPCATMENTINFDLQKPVSEDLYELFKPFGYINRTLGNPRLGEVYITDKNGKLQLRLQGRIGQRSLKVTVLDKHAGYSSGVTVVEQKIRCQITKYQMCMGCLGCESACPVGAITIQTERKGLKSYRISDSKCVRCGKCINHFDGGCYIRKVLCIKRT